MKTKYTGFTLIELMVVISIMALLLFGGLTAYRQFEERATLDNAFKELQANFALARQKALSGEKPSGNCDEFAGYGVYFDDNNITSYELLPYCFNGENRRLIPRRDLSEIIYLPAGVVLCAQGGSALPNSYIYYQALGRGTNLQGAYELELRYGDRCQPASNDPTISVVITPAGNVEKR